MVSGNPLHCNCSMVWLSRIAADDNATLTVDSPTCASPPNLYGEWAARAPPPSPPYLRVVALFVALVVPLSVFHCSSSSLFLFIFPPHLSSSLPLTFLLILLPPSLLLPFPLSFHLALRFSFRSIQLLLDRCAAFSPFSPPPPSRIFLFSVHSSLLFLSFLSLLFFPSSLLSILPVIPSPFYSPDFLSLLPLPFISNFYLLLIPSPFLNFISLVLSVLLFSPSLLPLRPFLFSFHVYPRSHPSLPLPLLSSSLLPLLPFSSFLLLPSFLHLLSCPISALFHPLNFSLIPFTPFSS